MSDHLAHQISRVLRLRANEEIVLIPADARDAVEWRLRLVSVEARAVYGVVIAERAGLPEPTCAVTLCPALLKGERFDWLLQKATELGVARIVPVLSQRSVVRLDKAQAESKAVHWRAVAVSACEQCGRNRLPIIEAAQPLLNYLGDSAPGTGPRLLFEPESASRPRAAERESRHPADIGIAAAEIAIGPEGGFAGDELEAFRVAGFSKVGLGPRVLRTETAAIAAVVWLQARFGDM